MPQYMPQYLTIAELQEVCGRFLFLIKLQDVKIPPEMFSWEFFKSFWDSYSSEHPWTAASEKLIKPWLQHQNDGREDQEF